MSPSGFDREPTKRHQVLVEEAWGEVQQACYALGGAHGPRRRAAKAELVAALERLQRAIERDENRSTPGGKRTGMN